MPIPDGSGWYLQYDDPQATERLLVSFPYDLRRDLRVLSSSEGISDAELIRRAVTRELAMVIRERPEISKSFRGKLPV